MIEEGKKKVNVGDKTYLLELPLRADVAIIGGSLVVKKPPIPAPPHLICSANVPCGTKSTSISLLFICC